MTVNKDAINNTIEAIRNSDELEVKFDMHDFHHEATCGTFCCLAGFAVIAEHGSLKEVDLGYMYIDGRAGNYLGLTATQESQLFYPTGVKNIHYASPQDGIKVLEHLRDTGDVDWGIIDYVNLDDYAGYVYKPNEKQDD